jgi:hypothetical protein
LRLGKRTAKTNARGVARLRMRLYKPGRRVIVVRAPGGQTKRVHVHVKILKRRTSCTRRAS